MRMLKTTILATGFTLALGTLSTIAIAAGSGPSNGGAGNTTVSPQTLNCKKGEVVKTVKRNGKKVKICVKAQSSGLSDDQLYDQGRLLAKAGEYDWAIAVLSQVKNQNDPKVLNYIGYSNRKAGRLDVGIGYYNRALALNPDFVLAREYLGEGYVAAGRVDLAKLQLTEIKNRCGTSCEEYRDLSEAISKAGY